MKNLSGWDKKLLLALLADFKLQRLRECKKHEEGTMFWFRAYDDYLLAHHIYLKLGGRPVQVYYPKKKPVAEK